MGEFAPSLALRRDAPVRTTHRRQPCRYHEIVGDACNENPTVKFSVILWEINLVEVRFEIIKKVQEML